MNALVSVVVLVLLGLTLSAVAEQTASNQANKAQIEQRQGRSISGNSGSINSLSHSSQSVSSGSNSNVIEHSTGKSRLEQEKRQVQEFLTAKNMFKSIIKLLFGNQEEISATSRNVLGIIGKVSLLLSPHLVCHFNSETNNKQYALDSRYQ